MCQALFFSVTTSLVEVSPRALNTPAAKLDPKQYES